MSPTRRASAGSLARTRWQPSGQRARRRDAPARAKARGARSPQEGLTCNFGDSTCTGRKNRRNCIIGQLDACRPIDPYGASPFVGPQSPFIFGDSSCLYGKNRRKRTPRGTPPRSRRLPRCDNFGDSSCLYGKSGRRTVNVRNGELPIPSVREVGRCTVGKGTKE